MMKTSHKIFLGLAIASQFVGVALFLLVFVYLVKNAPADAGVEYFEGPFAIMNLVGVLFTAYCTAILVILIIHATRNPHIEMTGMRTTWLLLLILFGPLAMLFYWFQYIWRDEVPKSGPLGLN